MMKKFIKPLLFLVLVIAVIVVVSVYDISRFFSLGYVKSQLDVWLTQVRENFFVVAVIFFVIYVAVTALSIPGAPSVMTLLAGALFDLGWGIVIVSFASTLGATLSFLVARFFLRDSLAKKFKNQFEKINKGVEKEGAFYLFALCMVPIVPFFIINLVMGLTRIPVVVYAVVSQFGMLAGTFVYVNIGRSLATLSGVSGILSPQLWISFILLAAIPIASKKIISAMKTSKVYKPFKHDKPKQFDYNIAVIGAGSGGLIASYVAAVIKAKVILFEKSEMGGDCLNRGCVPSKALLSTAKLAHVHEDSKNVGVSYTRPIISFSKVMKSVHEAIASVAPHDSVKRYESLGVECVQEEAFIRTPWKIQTKTRTITAKKIIVATGGVPIIPKIPGLLHAKPYTSDTIWSLKVKPRKMLVIGGGPIGCELARAFGLLGASVSVVQRPEHVLHREDCDVAAVAEHSLTEAGVTVHTGITVKEVKKLARGEFTAVLEKTDGNSSSLKNSTTNKSVLIPFDTVLVAAGRRAETKLVGLHDLGVAFNPDGTIAADEYLRTSIPNIYAVGDAVGPYQFTHTAGHTAWYAAVNALVGAVKKFPVDYRVVPAVTFLDPEIARVGLNEREAQEKGIAYEVVKYEMSESDRALAERKTKGFVKVLTVPGKDTILGATVAAERAGEIIGEFILAMKYKLGLNKIMGTIHPYPTFIESVKSSAGMWKKEHAPKKLLNTVGKILSIGIKKPGANVENAAGHRGAKI